MKQIVMITDGKPSALTMEGRINTRTLQVSQNVEEVSKCKRVAC